MILFVGALLDTAVIQAIQREARERPWQGLLTAVALDVVYDVASFALGHDLLTGEKLSHGEELFTAVAIAIPVVSIAATKYGGRLLRGGQQMATHVDEVGDSAKYAARHADELQDGARVTTRHSNELLDGAELAARRADDFGDAARLERRLDDWVSPDGQMARPGDETLQRQRLSQQVDGDVSHSLTSKPSDLHYKANQHALSQEEIYDKLAQSDTGQYILEQVDQIGKRPAIIFSDELLGTGRVGSYYARENVIRLNPELQELPRETLQATVAHELTHRIHRPLAGSQASEVMAHSVEAQVFRELGGPNAIRNLDLSELSDFQRSILATQERISQIRNVDEMLKYVRTIPEYRILPDFSISRVESHQTDLQRWKRYRADMTQQGYPNAFAEQIKEEQENIEFWKSFEE